MLVLTVTIWWARAHVVCSTPIKPPIPIRLILSLCSSLLLTLMVITKDQISVLSPPLLLLPPSSTALSLLVHLPLGCRHHPWRLTMIRGSLLLTCLTFAGTYYSPNHHLPTTRMVVETTLLPPLTPVVAAAAATLFLLGDVPTVTPLLLPSGGMALEVLRSVKLIFQSKLYRIC